MVVDLVAVTVALVDDGLAVDLAGARALVELHRVGAQAHRAADVGDFLLLGQEVDDRVRRLGIELGRVGAVEAGDVAGELDDRDLHAEADAEERDALLAGDARRADLALDAANRRIRPGSGRRGSSAAAPRSPRAESFSEFDPDDFHLAAVVDRAVAQRFDN